MRLRTYLFGTVVLAMLALTDVIFSSRPAAAQNPLFGAAQTPVQFELLNRGGSFPTFPVPPSVPFVVAPDKRLTIEHISSECLDAEAVASNVPAGQIRLSVENSGKRVTHYFHPKLQAIDSQGTRRYGSNDQVRLYADPGTAVSVGPSLWWGSSETVSSVP